MLVGQKPAENDGACCLGAGEAGHGVPGRADDAVRVVDERLAAVCAGIELSLLDRGLADVLALLESVHAMKIWVAHGLPVLGLAIRIDRSVHVVLEDAVHEAE
eukprot:scaffold136088_cov295-Phaeocystis_antarctica.AAC.1